MRRIIYDGDSFYELDEECMKQKEESERRKETKEKGNKRERGQKRGNRKDGRFW